MLSWWPDLFHFSSFAPTILRLALGGIFLFFGARELLKSRLLTEIGWPKIAIKIVGVWEFLIGFFLLIGLFTQMAALLAGLEILGYLFLKLKNKEKIPLPIDYLLIMLAVCISLILLGPGLLALDLPL